MRHSISRPSNPCSNPKNIKWKFEMINFWSVLFLCLMSRCRFFVLKQAQSVFFPCN
jgi:hypothetical protein